jgi:Flp pilus assembly pilin Flp
MARAMPSSTEPDPTSPLERTALRCNEAGTTTVEYVVILVLVGVGASLALAAMAALLARFFGAQQAWLLLPFP